MSLLGLGLTIGGNLLGGIMGRKSQRKANRRAEENARAAADLAYERSKEYKPLHLKKMVAEAEAAGFNPLTILRNGGMGSTMGPGYGGATVSPAPEQSLGSVFAETLTGVGQYYMNQPTANEVADDNLRREIMQAELDNLKADTNRMQQRPFGAGIPSATTTSDHQNPHSMQTGDGYYHPVGDLYGSDGLLLRRDLPTPLGEYDVAESVAPTQAIEDEYGDVVAAGYGLFKATTDIGYNMHKGLRHVFRNVPNVEDLPGALLGRHQWPTAANPPGVGDMRNGRP